MPRDSTAWISHTHSFASTFRAFGAGDPLDAHLIRTRNYLGRLIPIRSPQSHSIPFRISANSGRKSSRLDSTMTHSPFKKI